MFWNVLDAVLFLLEAFDFLFTNLCSEDSEDDPQDWIDKLKKNQYTKLYEKKRALTAVSTVLGLFHGSFS